MLNHVDRERFSRHLLIDCFEEKHQVMLKRGRVLVVGAGGLGCPILQYIVAAGVGSVGIADADVVSLSNLQRQILFTENEIGTSKVEVAGRKMRALNSECEITTYNYLVTEDNVTALIKDYDIIVGAVDNFAARYLLDCAAEEQNKVYIHGAILDFQGQVTTLTKDSKARYADLFPDAGDGEELSLGVVGALPGIIGSIMAMEVIKVLCEFSDTLENKLLLYNSISMTQTLLDTSQF